jgi:hypothetical protein
VGSQLREALNSATLGPAKWSAPNGVWITDINEDAAGRLWVATNVGIYVLGKSGGVQHIAQEQGLSALWVNKLLRDRAGELWAGTRNGLALIGDSSGAPGFRVRRIYTEKDGLPNHDVIAMAEAPDGALKVLLLACCEIPASTMALATSWSHGLPHKHQLLLTVWSESASIHLGHKPLGCRPCGLHVFFARSLFETAGHGRVQIELSIQWKPQQVVHLGGQVGQLKVRRGRPAGS